MSDKCLIQLWHRLVLERERARKREKPEATKERVGEGKRTSRIRDNPSFELVKDV